MEWAEIRPVGHRRVSGWLPVSYMRVELDMAAEQVMTIIVDHGHGADEGAALAQLAREGFSAAAKDYEPGRTEPHQHDHDICIHVLKGEFKLADVAAGVVHRCGPGARAFVACGTPHFEAHDELRLVVGRRFQPGPRP